LKVTNILNVAGHYFYFSVFDERFCIFVPEAMVRWNVFMVICVLLSVISTREVYEPSAFEFQIAI
jgi:hypothetical protein